MLETTKPKPQAPMITIIGMPGAGKSTLAALFEKPVFIQAESSTTVFEDWPEADQPDFMPQLPTANRAREVRTSVVLLAQLRSLATEKHEFKTVVIDTATSLNMLFEKEIIEFNEVEVNNIGEACGGFNKGYLAVANLHAEVRMACEHLRRRGLTIVFLAHSGIVRTKNRPDVEAYSTFTIDMNEASRRVYIAQVDAVIYLKIKEHVIGQETDRKGNVRKYGKLISTGDRVLITASDGVIGYVDAKARYDFPKEIDFIEGENPLIQYIPFLRKTNTTTEGV